MRLLQAIIFYLSYLVFPFLLWLLKEMWTSPGLWHWWLMLVLAILFVYARFVEPNQIKIVEEYFNFKEGRYGRAAELVQENMADLAANEGNLRVAVIADLHLGILKGRKFLKRVVKMLIDLKPELILIAGDFINDPSKAELADLFTELAELEVSVLAVTGNHDARTPGRFESAEVRAAVEKFGVQTLDNGRAHLVKGKYRLNIFGLSDLMEGKMDLAILDKMSDGRKEGEFNLILAHNPDTAHSIPANLPVNLMISGHTHGGQIRLPIIYKWLIPCKFDFDRGWYEVKGLKVLVSSGLGEVVLPMRLGVPPEIILLNLKLS